MSSRLLSGEKPSFNSSGKSAFKLKPSFSSSGKSAFKLKPSSEAGKSFAASAAGTLSVCTVKPAGLSGAASPAGCGARLPCSAGAASVSSTSAAGAEDERKDESISRLSRLPKSSRSKSPANGDVSAEGVSAALASPASIEKSSVSDAGCEEGAGLEAVPAKKAAISGSRSSIEGMGGCSGKAADSADSTPKSAPAVASASSVAPSSATASSFTSSSRCGRPNSKSRESSPSGRFSGTATSGMVVPFRCRISGSPPIGSMSLSNCFS